MAEPDLADWLSTCRLSAFGNDGPYLGDPATQAAFGRLIGAQGPAVENLQRLLAEHESSETARPDRRHGDTFAGSTSA